MPDIFTGLWRSVRALVSPSRAEPDRPVEEAALDLEIEIRRIVEAGVVVSLAEWEELGDVGELLCLLERQRVREAETAHLARAILDEFIGGNSAEDMAFEHLDEETQDATLRARLHRDSMVERLKGENNGDL